MINNTELIIIEGLTGTGKSTLGHILQRQLDRQGIPNQWIHEGEAPHPIFPAEELDPTAFLTEMPGRWGDFLEQNRAAGTVAIVEASFFNNLIETPFVQNVERQTVIDFGNCMQDVVAPYSPALIYLYRPNIEDALNQIYGIRGEGYRDFVVEYVEGTPYAQAKGYQGSAGTVNFWQDFWDIINELFEGYQINKLAVDPPDNWESYHQTICEYLELPYTPEPPVELESVAEIVGEYNIQGTGQSWRIWHDADNNQIRINNNNVLLPLADNRFAMRSTHFEFAFQPGHDRQPTQFEVQGRDLDYFELVGTVGTMK